MTFRETQLAGVFEIGIERKHDERGFFARTWCEEEFTANGLNPRLSQCSISFNARRGTLRGMHYQDVPHWETKVIRCTKGALYDVVLDLRRDSPTFKMWLGFVLTAENREMLYVPEGCAHGFLSLQDETEVLYQISDFYYPELSRGVRWNDPTFQIKWPSEVNVISERDRAYPDFET